MADQYLASTWARKALRSFRTNVEGKLRPMSAPNPTTLFYQPPAYFKPAVINYPEYSKDLVLKIQKLENEQQSLVLAKKKSTQDFPLLRFAPFLKPNPSLNSEGDVVREANFELINWVLLALEQVTGLTINVHSESSDLSQNDKSRPDMIWFYVVPGKPEENEKDWVLFAALEFKNTKIIDIDGFQPAIFDNQPFTEAQFYNIALQEKNETLIAGNNALWLTKQMTKYAKTLRVPHQVAFDWSTMLAIDFGSDLGEGPSVPPESVQIAWLKEESKGGTDFKTHRSFLLGYLHHALQETIKRQEIEPN